MTDDHCVAGPTGATGPEDFRCQQNWYRGYAAALEKVLGHIASNGKEGLAGWIDAHLKVVR